MVRVRFAPSPTGPLHIGGARTALFNYLIARKLGGKFILRIDDTDRERSLPEYEADIKSSLHWLGLDWDEGPELGGEFAPYRQSERQARHIAAAEALVTSNAAYRDSEGVVRLRYPDSEIVVEDLICGRCVFHPNSLGPEVILVRSDGTPTYHLASVADDIDMRITHVIRGQDHLTNTAKHVLLFQGLGSALPTFAHLPLILGEDGSKLSKRNSSGRTTVNDFRQAGYLNEALLNFLVLLGWSHPDAMEHISLEEAVRSFALERIGKTASVFETARLNYLNGWWIRHLPVERVAEQLRPFLKEYEPLLESRGSAFWLQTAAFFKEEIGFLTEAPKLAQMLFAVDLELSQSALSRLNDPELRDGTRTVIEQWLELLKNTAIEGASEFYSKDDFSRLTSALKKSFTGDKKTLFQGLRIAIMADTSGPELNAVVPLVPRDVLLSRARSVLANA
ncbi:MAG: glutamate--tRNA ligase family protein [Bdellovibrionota bacterium]